MNVYVQSTDGIYPYNENGYKAWLGFHEMGIDPIIFTSIEDLKDANPEDIVVGGIGMIQKHLERFGIHTENVDYPAQLEKYLGRKVWKTTADEVSHDPDLWPVFLKPVEDKRFVGKVIRSTKDLIGCGTWGELTPAIASEPVNFLREYRVFVRYGKILDIRAYKGDLSVHYDYSVIKAAVDEFSDGYAAFSLDFGVTDDGRTLLVEMNDGYSLGNYGLEYHLYTKLLSARWAELTGTDDYCDFELERFEWKEKQTPIRSLV
ncbi:MAG: ATP-grasp domain-containing protein [Erysipelotrichaceae bacterium]|nr:ATP-grasp domain-containing protein [Erysipelotrichaceae bacterium]